MSTKCITPFYKKDMPNVPLPCGKCPPCVKKRVSNWSVRLLKEGERSSSSLFVTLTYDTRTVPMVTNGMSLSKEDVQKFFKRLRKQHQKNKRHGRIKYYLAGEYGGHTYRPHYHIILFNSHYADVMEAWQIDGKAIGSIHFGTVSAASIGYSLKYISKPKKIPQYEGDKRQPEFALMSKGMGDNYIKKKIFTGISRTSIIDVTTHYQMARKHRYLGTINNVYIIPNNLEGLRAYWKNLE